MFRFRLLMLSSSLYEQKWREHSWWPLWAQSLLHTLPPRPASKEQRDILRRQSKKMHYPTTRAAIRHPLSRPTSSRKVSLTRSCQVPLMDLFRRGCRAGVS